MTKPTQAQIDAARLRRWQDVVTQAMACIRGETPEDVAFGEAEDDTFSKLRQVDAEIAAALTAAAEVVVGKSGYEYISTHDEIVAATIERCAQKVKDYFSEVERPDGDELVSEIRALSKEDK